MVVVDQVVVHQHNLVVRVVVVPVEHLKRAQQLQLLHLAKDLLVATDQLLHQILRVVVAVVQVVLEQMVLVVERVSLRVEMVA